MSPFQGYTLVLAIQTTFAKRWQQDFGPSIKPIIVTKKGQLTLAKNRNTKRQKNKRRKKVLKIIILL